VSTLSPGSKATTNIFMVLGAVALIALVMVQNLSVEETVADVSVNCDDRLISLDLPAQQNLAGISLMFSLFHDGSINQIAVVSQNSEQDQLAIHTLETATFKASRELDTEVLCEYTFE
jgi:hypothetical protein